MIDGIPSRPLYFYRTSLGKTVEEMGETPQSWRYPNSWFVYKGKIPIENEDDKNRGSPMTKRKHPNGENYGWNIPRKWWMKSVRMMLVVFHLWKISLFWGL